MARRGGRPGRRSSRPTAATHGYSAVLLDDAGGTPLTARRDAEVGPRSASSDRRMADWCAMWTEQRTRLGATPRRDDSAADAPAAEAPARPPPDAADTGRRARQGARGGAAPKVTSFELRSSTAGVAGKFSSRRGDPRQVLASRRRGCARARRARRGDCRGARRRPRRRRGRPLRFDGASPGAHARPLRAPIGARTCGAGAAGGRSGTRARSPRLRTTTASSSTCSR